MGNVCFKGYSPKKTPKDEEKKKEDSQNGETLKADIDVTHHNHSVPKQDARQTSQVSLQSTLSNEEVSDFFSSSDDKYEISRQWSRELRDSSAKSRDDLNANDIRLDLRGATNPAFSSDNEELDLRLQVPKSESLQSSPEHQAELIRVPDSFKLSKYVINKDQDTFNDTLLNNQNIVNSETKNDHDQFPRSMSSEEVVDLIDKLLHTNPGQSSNDFESGTKFSVDSSESSQSTSQENSSPHTPQEQHKMDTFNVTGHDKRDTFNITGHSKMDTFSSTDSRGKLTRMTHVYELPEDMDITLRNEVLLETGHKAESQSRHSANGSSSNSSSVNKNVIMPNELPNGPSITSDYSVGEDEDELWTGIEMTEQNLLSRVAGLDLTKHDEAVDILDNISRQRQRMLNLRWSIHAPPRDDQELPQELAQEKLMKKLEVEKSYSQKLDDLNHQVASNLINAQKRREIDMESLQQIVADHKRRQSALHAQLMAQKDRIERHLAEKLKDNCKADDFDEDSESKIENILGLSLDEIRQNPNRDCSIETASPLDFDGRFSRIGDHCGVVVHDSDVDDHETDDLILTAYEELLDQNSNDEEPLSADESAGPFNAKNHSFEEESIANSELRSTLKEDVKTNISKMTKEDFNNLLDVYRQEKDNNVPGSTKGNRNSLWEKMESNRQIPSKSDASTEIGKSMMMLQQNDVAVQATEIKQVNQDVQTIQKKFLQEVENLDSDLLNKLSKREDTMTQQELEKLLKSHFDTVEDLRKRRKHESDKIQKKLEEKLRSKMRKLPSEDSEGRDDVIMRNSLVGSNAETEYKVHKREMENTDIKIEEKETEIRKEIANKANELSVDDVKQLIRDHRKQQRDLIQRRDIRRKLMNDKLLAVLEERKLQKRSSQDANKSEEPELPKNYQDASNKVGSRKKNVLDEDVEEMDSEFYKDLMDRYGKSSFSEGELERLLEEHLNKVDNFKKRVKSALSKKRKERSAEEKERRRIKKLAKRQAEEANEIRANELVQKQQEQMVQMRQLRDRERKRASMLLREKLAKKQQAMHGEALVDTKLPS